MGKNIVASSKQLSLLGKGSAISIVVDVGMARAFAWHPDQEADAFATFMDLLYSGLPRLRNNGKKVDVQLGHHEDDLAEELSAWMGRLEKEAKVSGSSL